MTTGRRSGTILAFGETEGWDIAVVVPAKNEADRIAGCLSALAVSAAHLPDVSVGIVLVVNNTTDDTVARARDWAAGLRGEAALVVIDHHFEPARSGVGHARRLGFELALDSMPDDGVFLMTDADTHVGPTWIVDNLCELRGADVVCGCVDAIADEQRQLPPEISRHGSWESDYVATALQLAAALDPLPHDPRPAHHNGAGASMAFRKSVYQAVGGLPALQVGEDRAFVEQAEALDFRIRYSDRPVVYTSCRMTGRTDGGMAGALRERRDLPDPPSDEWLEPAATFHLRHALRGALRAAWPAPDRVADVLQRFLGAEAAALREGPVPVHFGQFFQQIEARAQALLRVRMHQSDCRRELPTLQRLLDEQMARPQRDLDPGFSRAGAAELGA